MYKKNKLSVDSRFNTVIFLYLNLLLLLSATDCFSQTAVPRYMDSIGSRLGFYGIKNQAPVMFVHFDKTVYAGNENVWFTAYLVNAVNMDLYKVISVMCIKDDDHTIAFEDRFTMKKGLAFGNMAIPDSVPPGNYSLIAYTNRLLNGKPEVSFTQPITIKTAGQQGFTASLSPIDTAITSAVRKVRLMVNKSAVDGLPNAQVNYYVGSALRQVLTGKIKTDIAGQYVFTIPSKLLSQGSNMLHVQVSSNKEVKEISMALPVSPQPAIAGFYPEGGSMVINQPCTVGWEVKTASGDPVMTTAILYQDDKVINNHIETGRYGMGKFLLKPQAGSNYYVKLTGISQKDTLYKLPAAITGGPVLTLKQALADDTLFADVNDDRPRVLYLVVHNYKQLFFAIPVMMNKPHKKLELLLKDIPKGLTQLTLTDSLGRPFAARLFFAHYNQQPNLQITTDQGQYATRKKVTVKVKLNGALGRQDIALVSIACVQDNRIEIKKQNDIASYVYLKHELNGLPLKEHYLDNSEDNRQYLENVLLIKGWLRYTWTDVLRAQPADTLHNYNDLAFKGTVALFTRVLKKPLALVLMNGHEINTATTDSTGNFSLDNNNLASDPGKKLFLQVSADNPGGYHIRLPDPYQKMNMELSKVFTPADYHNPPQQNTQMMQLADDEHAIHLKEVKITDRNDNSFLNSMYGTNANECGDYVCRYNVLNCPNHTHEMDNRPAIVGRAYYINGQMSVYSGCKVRGIDDDYVLKFKGIYNAQQFYPDDYAQVSPPQPQYLSTIYWKNLLQLTTAGDAAFSFYTGDITGKFKIVIQGITDNDVVYGEKTFNVIKAK